MTFEPPAQPDRPSGSGPAQPPQPPSQPSMPPPPPPAERGPAAPSELGTVNPMDWGILVAGFLALIFSFFDYYTYRLGPFSVTYNAWDGFFGWFSTMVAVLSTALLALHIFLPSVRTPVSLRALVLAGFALSLLCAILAGFVDSRETPGPIDSTRNAGYWLSLAAIFAGTVVSTLRLRETSGKLHWGHRKG